MPDAIDDLKIINNALARIGGGAIGAIDEDSDLAAQAAAVYFDRVDAIFGAYTWSFAKKTYKLDAVAPTADNGYEADKQCFITGWRNAFALPGTRLGVPRKVLRSPSRHDDPLRDFAIEENWLYADVGEVYAVVTVRADPLAWPPVFRLAVTTSVAADLCVPVTHDAGLASNLRVMAEGTPDDQGRGGLLGRAIGADAAGSRGAAPLHNDPLTDARLT